MCGTVCQIISKSKPRKSLRLGCLKNDFKSIWNYEIYQPPAPVTEGGNSCHKRWTGYQMKNKHQKCEKKHNISLKVYSHINITMHLKEQNRCAMNYNYIRI